MKNFKSEMLPLSAFNFRRYVLVLFIYLFFSKSLISKHFQPLTIYVKYLIEVEIYLDIWKFKKFSGVVLPQFHFTRTVI